MARAAHQMDVIPLRPPKAAWRKCVLMVLTAVFGLFLLAPAAHAAALDEIFSKADPLSTKTVDHTPWDRLLAAYIRPGPDDVNLFTYGAVSAQDKTALKSYISALEGVKVSSLARPEQLAYWINLYNAVTIDVVLDNYPVTSIREIKSGVFSSGPWSKEQVTVDGHELSLDDIEHEILRPIWQTRLIHYGVNCASIGCPNLAPRAYTGKNAQAQLEQGAADYINSPRGVRIDDGRIVASKLFKWYDDDFGSEADLIAHLKKYAKPGLRAKLEGRTEIYDYDYDWTLNAPR